MRSTYRNSCWGSGKVSPWFEVDLGAVYQLDHIVIYGRDDREQEKIMGAKVSPPLPLP